jgi:hypothetical protein
MVTLYSCSNRIQNVLVAERLEQEIYSAVLHCSYRHRNITMTGYQNDRKVIAKTGKLLFNIRARSSQATHIEHSASR